MKQESILVANVKCSGCVTTIQNELLKLKGVHAVQVDVEQDTVHVDYENLGRDILVKRLLDLGYPEATEQNGLLLQLKSYASCMLGRMSTSARIL